MTFTTYMRRAATVVGGSAVALALAAGSASAHECVNISKQNQAAGVQIVFGDGPDPVWISDGLQKRIDAGVVDLDTGEGFHGLIGIDFDGDGVTDAATFIVGPEGEISEKAQANGSPCHGIVNIEALFSCLGG